MKTKMNIKLISLRMPNKTQSPHPRPLSRDHAAHGARARGVALGIITLLLAVMGGVCFAAEKPKALLAAFNDAEPMTAALRAAGFDVIQGPRLSPAPSAEPAAAEKGRTRRRPSAGVPTAPASAAIPGLADTRLVVVSADAAIPDNQAAQIADFVRSGGGLLVVNTSDDANFWWDTYRRPGAGTPKPSPLWDVLPFVSVPMSDQVHRGMRNPFGPTRVLRQADSPLLAGVDLKAAPTFPFHSFMILPTHPIVQNSHVMFAWSEDQYKSPLWGNGQVLAWGDDPEQRPLLLTAQYGAGRCAAAAVPLLNKTFLAWPGSQVLLKNLTTWLAGPAQPAAPAAIAETKVYGVGLPWIVCDSLKRMGLAVTDQAADASGAIVYGKPTADQVQAVAQLARANKPVVVANPACARGCAIGRIGALGLPSFCGRRTGGRADAAQQCEEQDCSRQPQHRCEVSGGTGAGRGRRGQVALDRVKSAAPRPGMGDGRQQRGRGPTMVHRQGRRGRRLAGEHRWTA